LSSDVGAFNETLTKCPLLFVDQNWMLISTG